MKEKCAWSIINPQFEFGDPRRQGDCSLEDGHYGPHSYEIGEIQIGVGDSVEIKEKLG